MGWGQKWPDRQPRPGAAKLDGVRLQGIQERILSELDQSPILVSLGVKSKASRGRFYLERGAELLGRITPLAGREIQFLLESPYGSTWTEKGRGHPEALIQLVANDEAGTFHGLGALNRALIQRGAEAQLDAEFRYPDGSQAGPQEAMFFHLGVPVEVLAQPRSWYLRQRNPRIVQIDWKYRQILVDFQAYSGSGESFGGRCLYLVHDNRWRCFTLRPNQSHDINLALVWLDKRNWVGWR